MATVVCTIDVRVDDGSIQHFPLTVRTEGLDAAVGVTTQRASSSTALNLPVTTASILFVRPKDQATAMVEQADTPATRIVLNPTGMLCYLGTTMTIMRVASTPDGEIQTLVAGTTAL